MGMAGKLLGGNLGQGLGMAGVLKDAGLSREGGQQFIVHFMTFARSHVGQELVERVLSSLPKIAKMAG